MEEVAIHQEVSVPTVSVGIIIYNSGNQQSQGKRNRTDYCWNFNKGIPCKFGSRCKFIERCKYCDSPTHGVHACNKLQKKESGYKSGSNVTTSSNQQTK